MNALKSWQTAVAAAYALCFWVVVLAIPENGPSWDGWLRWTIGIVGGLIVAGSLIGLVACVAKNNWGRAPGLVYLGLLGVVLVIVSLVTGHDLNFTDDKRLAVGVGGLAIAGLVYGVTRFDSIRAAASIPAAVLVIGAATWPNSDDLIPADFRSEIVKWMGILLAANGVAEAVKQVGEANATAKVQAAAPPAAPPPPVTTQGDFS